MPPTLCAERGVGRGSGGRETGTVALRYTSGSSLGWRAELSRGWKYLAVVSALLGSRGQALVGLRGQDAGAPKGQAGVLTHAGLDCDVGGVLTYLGRVATQILHVM